MAAIGYLAPVAAGIVVLAVLLTGGEAIKCWECNSSNDPNCADPFQNYTISYTDCDQRYLQHYPNSKASICRKIIQKVDNNYRYIRSCGWLTDQGKESVDCIKRAGTFQVFVHYCHCNENGCNGANAIGTPLISVGAALLIALVAKS